MILRLGPVTVMSSRQRACYADLANAAYRLHQAIWYVDDMCDDSTQELLVHLDTLLASALSYTPPEDILSDE